MTDQPPSLQDQPLDQAADQNAAPSPTSPAGWRFETKQVQAGHDPLAEPAQRSALGSAARGGYPNASRRSD